MTGKQRIEGILLNLLLIQGQKNTLRRIIVPVPNFCTWVQRLSIELQGGKVKDLIGALFFPCAKAAVKNNRGKSISCKGI